MTRHDYKYLISLFQRLLDTVQEIDDARMEIVSNMSLGDGPFSRQDVLDYLTMVSIDWEITPHVEAFGAILDVLQDYMPKEDEP